MSTTTSYRLSGIALVVISPKTVRNYVSNIISKLQVAGLSSVLKMRVLAFLAVRNAFVTILGRTYGKIPGRKAELRYTDSFIEATTRSIYERAVQFNRYH